MIKCTCYHYLEGQKHKDCDGAQESRKIGYVHMGLLIPVLDLFLQGHIDRLYLEETINELTVFKSSPDEGNVE